MNKVNVEVVNGNLMDSFQRLQGLVDVLIFNPPVRLFSLCSHQNWIQYSDSNCFLPFSSMYLPPMMNWVVTIS